MTVKEVLAELEYWRRKAASFKHQMEVNRIYDTSYENALMKISKMCGWVKPKDCIGCPDNINKIAVREVSKVIKRLNQLNEGN